MDFFGLDDEDRSFSHAVAKDDFIHPDGDEAARREVEARGNPACLIDPTEKAPTKEKPELVQVLRKDKALGLHGE